MSQVVMPPSREILRAANLLEQAISRLIHFCSATPGIGTYEADVECRTFLVRVLRHVEGVIALRWP
jgi:hypothetical protein